MTRNHLYIALIVFCLALSLALTGCNTTRSSGEGGVSVALSREEVEKQLMEKPFVIGIDDVVNVYVRGDPEVTGEYVVSPEGTIFLRMLGDVKAAGLTKAELKRTLTERLSEFIIEPEVTVGISAYRSKKVYVIGEVAMPGPVPMRGNILTVWDAIVSAGLPLKTAALWRVHVITPDVEEPVAKRVNLRKIMYRGKFAQNDFLNPGDIVVVPSSTAASLGSYLGQIVQPATYSRDMAEIYDFFKHKSIYLDRNYGRFAPAPK